MQVLMAIAGGVALILFGVRFLRKGLDRLFGARLQLWLERLAANRVRACVSGMAVSLLAPSSTTMSILAVQVVQSRQLATRQMLAVMLGANIGLTAMVAFIALRVDEYAPLLILIGVVLFQFFQTKTSRGAGQVILSLGFMLLGISLIKASSGQIQPEGDLHELLNIAQRYPWGIALIAVLLTMLLQSSTAAIGLVIGLGAADLVQLPLAVALVAGANVGVAVNTLIFGFARPESRRLGIGLVIPALVTAALVLLFITPVVHWLERVDIGLDRQIAVTHTGFNVLLVLLFLPLINPLTQLVTKLIPDPHDTEGEPFGPKYIHRGAVESANFALALSQREVLRVAELVRQMLSDLWHGLERQDATLVRQVQKRDDQIDLLDKQIKRYLADIPMRSSNADTTEEIMRQLTYLNQLETIGDIVDKNLGPLALKRIEQQIRFTDEGWAELNEFYQRVAHNVMLAETTFQMRDATMADALFAQKTELDRRELKLRADHFRRLHKGVATSHESSAVHLDLITHLKRINSAVTHVADVIGGVSREISENHGDKS